MKGTTHGGRTPARRVRAAGSIQRLGSRILIFAALFTFPSLAWSAGRSAGKARSGCRSGIGRERWWHSLSPRVDEFDRPIRKMHGERALRCGQGGGNWKGLLGWTESLRHGTSPPASIVGAVTWSAIGPLSDRSITDNSRPVEMEDFSEGGWKSNPKSELRRL